MDSLAQFIKSIDVFQELDEISAQRLAQSLEIRDYQPQETIIRRGEPGDCMFVIFSGGVRIPILDEHGQTRFITHLRERQIFGEMALLTGEPRSADVVANSKCRCLLIANDTLQALMHQHPEVARFLTTILGERLSNSGGIRSVGKYNLLGELGRGAMSVVYEGFHPGLERSVAIKMLSHELVYHQDFASRFRDEAKIIARLRHPNIVEVFDAEESYATFFIIMEKLSGLDLRQTLRTRGGMSFDEIRNVLREIASALHCAHTHGVIHRDVKPSNVVLSPEGQVKLTDFGLALLANLDDESSIPSDSVGTPCYMAPEQILRKPMDGRADIYALGMIAYELITGDPPFVGEVLHVLKQHLREEVPSVRLLNPDVPDDLDTFVRVATSKNPQKRYQSCQEIVDFLTPSTSNLSRERLRIETLTFVYDAHQDARVKELFLEIQKRAAKIEGLLLR